MPSPTAGLTTAFQYATVASPTTFTTVVGVQSITFSGDKVQTEKTTDMLTTSGVDTFIGTTQDPGSCDLKCLYEPGAATQVALEAIRLAAVAVNFKVLYPGS